MAFSLLPTREVIADDREIRVYVDGIQIEFDQSPVIIENRTMVPVRGVAEALGFGIAVENHAEISVMDIRLEKGIASNEIDVNASPVSESFASINLDFRRSRFNVIYDNPQNEELNFQTFDLSPQPIILNGRTLIGIRDLSNMLGANVEWCEIDRVVTITSLDSSLSEPTTLPISPTEPETTPENDFAQSVANTRSSITLPNRRLTDTELQAWINEYNSLGGASAFELEVVRLINLERAKEGLHALEISPALMMSARFKSQEMVDLDYFSHTSPVYTVGSFGGGRCTIADMFGHTAGRRENIVRGGTEPRLAVNAWMNSPGHRAAIMDSDVKTIGVGAFRREDILSGKVALHLGY